MITIVNRNVSTLTPACHLFSGRFYSVFNGIVISYFKLTENHRNYSLYTAFLCRITVVH